MMDKQGSLLLVDDEEDILFLFKEMFSSCFEYVDTARDGQEAYDKILSQKFDVVLLDLSIPKTKGKALINQIKACQPDIGVIAFSGCERIEVEGLLDKGYVDDFIPKPADNRFILNKIRRVINLKRGIERKVLVIEDDKDIASYFQEALVSKYETIHTAYSGKVAMEKLEADDYHLVLLDLVLPEIDGIEILQAIKKKDRSSPVIVVSGYLDDARMSLCQKYGADKVLKNH